MLFEWDSDKDATNLLKHGVSFSTAIQIFADPCLLEKYDENHSDAEDRWIALGMSYPGLLMVVYTIRDAENVYRIISARKANAREREEYRSRAV